ncbi:MAG: DUF1269 domain-containing protein [Burkholderiaceae bacterium]
MLVVMFDSEKAAEAGTQALRKLHTEGDITLYAMEVIARDTDGRVSVVQNTDRGSAGAGVGLAVGALVGMMAGPLGLAAGAVTGTLAGAIRDFWVAGVDLDFVEEAEKMLQPGKVALVAEVDEEWVVPADSALESSGGTVYRRARSEIVDTQFDRDIATFDGEIEEFEAEAAHTTGVARSKLQVQVVTAKAGLARAVQNADRQVEALQGEADAKAKAISEQLTHAKGEVKGRLEDRVKRMKSTYHARGAKLSKAWGLTKEALAV